MSNDDEKNEAAEPEAIGPEKTDKRPKFRRHRKVPQPPPRWKLIDKEFARPARITEKGEVRRGTVFDAITMMLAREVAKGHPSALKILRKYEAYAAARPKVRVEPDMSLEEAAKVYREFCATGKVPGAKPPSKAEIKRAEERAKEWANLTQEEAAEVYHATLKGGSRRDGI